MTVSVTMFFFENLKEHFHLLIELVNKTFVHDRRYFNFSIENQQFTQSYTSVVFYTESLKTMRTSFNIENLSGILTHEVEFPTPSMETIFIKRTFKTKKRSTVTRTLKQTLEFQQSPEPQNNNGPITRNATIHGHFIGR